MNDTNNGTLKYKKEIAIRNYAVVFLILFLVAILSRSLGDSTQLLLLKLAAVPLFFLSFGGLKSIYRHPIIEHRLTPRSIEFSVLDGLLYALFIFIILWTPEETTAALVLRFAVVLLVVSLFKMVFLLMDVKRIAGLKDDQSPG